MSEVIVPQSHEHWLELRSKNINSTEVAALFNCSPYMTVFELWHLRKQNIKDNFEENSRMIWGKRLEDAIAKGIAQDQGWIIKKKSEYIQDPKLRMGASFDYSILDPIKGEKALLEIKNVDSLAFKNGWEETEDGGLEAPLHIELQLQAQLEMADLPVGYIGAFVGGNTPVILERERDKNIGLQIKKKITEFWISIDKGIEPKPDFEKDFNTIKELYKVTTKGKAVEGTPQLFELAEKYSRLSERIKLLENEKKAVQAQIITFMGDAEKILGENYTVSSGLIEKKEYTVKPSIYRGFRVTFKEIEP